MFIWTLKEAKKSSLIKNIFVSSENNKILRICKKFKFKTIKRPKYLSTNGVFKLEVIKHAVREIEKTSKKKVTLVISAQGNSPEIKMSVIEKSVVKIIKDNLQEVITVNKDLNCNGAIRVMTRKTLFQESLSTNHGFVISNMNDIHYKKDLKKLPDLWK